MPANICCELQYLPGLELMCMLGAEATWWLPENDRFERRSYRNRCLILGANGVITLSVPVRMANKGLPMAEMEIVNEQDWQRQHWRSLMSAYGKTPFFEYYAADFEEIYQKSYTKLSDLNVALLQLCAALCEIDLTFCHASRAEIASVAGLIDMHNVLRPSVPYTERPYFVPARYVQPFGADFEPNLSIVDLLFNEGPNSRQLLHQSKVFAQRD